MRKLSIPSMIVICAYFLKEGKDVLSLHPVLQALVPEIEQIRQALIQSQPTSSASPNDETELRASLRSLDVQHDLLRRSLFYLLETAIQLAQDASIQQRWRTIQQTLFPTRLKIVNESYETEAGAAIRLGQSLLDASLKQELSTLSLCLGAQTFSAVQLVQDLAKLGLEMESQVNRLSALEHNNRQPPAKNPNAEQQARLAFFRLLRALQQAASFALHAHPERHALLFKSYEDELKKLENDDKKPS